MARKSALKKHKFTNKLILNQWLMIQFGIDPLTQDQDNQKPFHRLAAPLKDPAWKAWIQMACTSFTMHW